MRQPKTSLQFVLDEGVADSVGRILEQNGHKVIYANKEIPGSTDLVVCAFSELNQSILVAIDGDMKQIAKQHSVTNGQFSKLSLIKLSCAEWRCAGRIEQAMTLIEHEWEHSISSAGRRLFIEIKEGVIRIIR